MKPFMIKSTAIVAIISSACQASSPAFLRVSHISQSNNIMSSAIRTKLRPLKSLNEEEKDYISPMRERPKPRGGDVAYNNENIIRQNNYFTNIRKAGGSECILDIYARDPSTSGRATRFWFVGKVARCTGTVSKEAAVARQFNLLEEHACRIRPVELGRCFGKLDLYAAQGDSELKTSQNDVTIRLVKMPRTLDDIEKVPLLEVGLNLDIVTNQGMGFFVVRTEDGVVPPDMIF